MTSFIDVMPSTLLYVTETASNDDNIQNKLNSIIKIHVNIVIYYI